MGSILEGLTIVRQSAPRFDEAATTRAILTAPNCRSNFVFTFWFFMFSVLIFAEHPEADI